MRGRERTQRTYVAMLRKSLRSNYSVDFPDLPGCATGGSTREDAASRAEKALEFHLAGMVRDGKRFPKPRSVDAILEDPGHEQGEPLLVTVEA